MDFFNSIISFFEIIYNFIVNFVNTLLNLVLILTKAVTLPNLFMGFLFPALGASMLVVVCVGVLYKILGR